MHKLKFLAYAFLVAAFSGCTGTGVNTYNIYEPQSGSIKLDVSSLPDPSAYTSVSFELDGKQIGEDTDGSDGFSFTLDTVQEGITDGIHNVRAIGTTTTGTTEELLNNSLFIKNDGATPTATETASPDAEASPETGESPDAEVSPDTETSPEATTSPDATDSSADTSETGTATDTSDTTDSGSQLRRSR